MHERALRSCCKLHRQFDSSGEGCFLMNQKPFGHLNASFVTSLILAFTSVVPTGLMSFHQEFLNKCTQALCVLMCRDGEALIIFQLPG